MIRAQPAQLLVAASLLAFGRAYAETPPEEAPPEGDTPTEAEPSKPAPARATPSPHGPLSFYGFVELDATHDNTQSYGSAANNNVLARPGTYAGAHPRSLLTVQNSQLGVRIALPDFGSVRTTAQAEVDFFGAQSVDATEQAVYTTPAVRLRLFYARIETPVVDILAGQYHDLFGWGGEGFYMNSVAFLGVGGEIYHRNPQIRLSKTFASSPVTLNLAIAGARPIQRDSEVPDVQAGIKLSINHWTGATAQGFGQPVVLPMSLGVSAVGRRFAVAEFLTMPGDARTAYGGGVAGNIFLPVIPVRNGGDRGNGLSLTGEVSIGTGISDLYTGLTGGALFPLLPDPSGNLVPPPLYRPNVDSGIVTYDANYNLKTIDWQAAVVGLQYYLPVAGGRIWVAATGSWLESRNILMLTPEASRGGVFFRQLYVDGNLFWAATDALQVGLSYQRTQQTFGDLPFGTSVHPVGRNDRFELGLRLFF